MYGGATDVVRHRVHWRYDGILLLLFALPNFLKVRSQPSDKFAFAGAGQAMCQAEQRSADIYVRRLIFPNCLWYGLTCDLVLFFDDAEMNCTQDICLLRCRSERGRADINRMRPLAVSFNPFVQV